MGDVAEADRHNDTVAIAQFREIGVEVEGVGTENLGWRAKGDHTRPAGVGAGAQEGEAEAGRGVVPRVVEGREAGAAGVILVLGRLQWLQSSRRIWSLMPSCLQPFLFEVSEQVSFLLKVEESEEKMIGFDILSCCQRKINEITNQRNNNKD